MNKLYIGLSLMVFAATSVLADAKVQIGTRDLKRNDCKISLRNIDPARYTTDIHVFATRLYKLAPSEWWIGDLAVDAGKPRNIPSGTYSAEFSCENPVISGTCVNSSDKSGGNYFIVADEKIRLLMAEHEGEIKCAGAVAR